MPAEGLVNDLEEDAPDGEDINEDGRWTEEDDERLLLVCFGSDSCLISSPPGLRDPFFREIASDAPGDVEL